MDVPVTVYWFFNHLVTADTCLRTWLLLPLSWHSQTTFTLHPRIRNSDIFLRSRFLLVSNFSSQNSFLVFGIVEYLHPCRCQKHPWTKIAALYFGNTRSGDPGNRLSLITYRNPILWSAFLRAISGFVSFWPTAAMIFERILWSTVSMSYIVLMIYVVISASRLWLLPQAEINDSILPHAILWRLHNAIIWLRSRKVPKDKMEVLFCIDQIIRLQTMRFEDRAPQYGGEYFCR